ncbi:MAG TPA: putative nucleotidyltransferase substrate binding domain-containing protein, partial [Thermodesulfobacteriota bacterium]
RTRVLAAGRSTETPVAEVMSAPLVAVAADAPAFDALLAMTRGNFHHLGVIEEGRLVGVLGRDDLPSAASPGPIAMARAIEEAPSIEALAAAAPMQVGVLRALVNEGAGPVEAAAVVAELSDRLVRRVAALAIARLEAEGLGRPPVAWSLVAAGSEGRREQTLRTDQDSGLVYADPPEEIDAAAAAYFGRLGRAVGDGLARVGVPRCEGGYMAENPRWCQPLRVWRRRVASWFAEPEPVHLLEASVYLDMRPVAGGDDGPGRELATWACGEAPRHPLFLRLLARTAAERRPPIGLFGRLRTDWTGVHRGTIDLKGAGVFPVTQAMRVYALSYGLTATGTLERLAGAAARGAFTPTEAADLEAAYRVILRVRLAHQLAAVAAGRPPDNRVAPRRLDRIERASLTEAFRTVASLQRALAERFLTAQAG